MATLSRYSRVVVTGLGALAANGTGKDAFWKSLLACRSGIDRITLFDASKYPIQIAGEVKDFDITSYCAERVKPKRLARQTQLALAAVHMAIRDAGLTQAMLSSFSPLPIIIGVSSSAFEVIERAKEQLMSRGPEYISPYVVSACQPHATATTMASALNVKAIPSTISTGCPAGLDAIASAAAMIRTHQAEIAIAGGADAPVNPLAVACLSAAGMLPADIQDPGTASRPFDRDRKGGILSEGAGVLVLENMEHALARGATPLLEIVGYGMAGDKPGSESGSGLLATMNRAMANACACPEDLNYVCAHGPSDPTIDRVETEMIKHALGEQAYKVPVSSIKGVLGNPLAAAGPFQVIACAMAMQEGMIPPTANYENADPDCDLDYTPKPRRARIKTALINLHGLGGGNSSMIVRNPLAT